MGTMLTQANLRRNGETSTMRCRIGFGDDGTDYSMDVLPAGTLVTGMYVNVETVFNDSGTDLLKVGNAGSDVNYAQTADVTMTSTGLTVTGSFTGTTAFPQVLAADTTILVRYDGQNGTSTTGALTVDIVYVPLAT